MEWSPAERLVSGPSPASSATRPSVDVQSVLCGVCFTGRDTHAKVRKRMTEINYADLIGWEVPVEGLDCMLPAKTMRQVTRTKQEVQNTTKA
jgi:hypothetical protein